MFGDCARVHRCTLGFRRSVELSKDICSRAPKHVMHPLPMTFQSFPGVGQFPRQVWIAYLDNAFLVQRQSMGRGDRKMQEGLDALISAGTQWGYGLVSYGMAIFQSLKDIFQRPKFAGKSLKFRRERERERGEIEREREIDIYIYICWRVNGLSTFWPPES